MSGGFVKLDCGILDSTLWIDREGREVFITALLMASPYELSEPAPQLEVRSLNETGWTVPPGWYGFVPAAGVGIVTRAGLEREAGLAALERLGSPETDSRSTAFEGRRLVRVNGGYLVLNFMRYRDKDYSAAERMRRLRERRKNSVTPVTRNSDGVTRNVTQAEDREQRTEGIERKRTRDAAPPVAGGRARKRSKASSNVNDTLTVTATANGWSGNWVGPLVDLWRKHGEIKPGHLGKALEALKALHTFEDVERGLRVFLAAGQARFGPEMFARSAGDWIAGRAGSERKQQTITDRMVEATSEFLRTEGGS